MSNYDDFADVIQGQAGVFGTTEAALGPALADHDGCVTGVTPQGAAFEFRCGGCGKPRKLTLEYSELVALKYMISPHEAFQGSARQFCEEPTSWVWREDEHKWGLAMQCNMCKYHYPVRLGPQEPEQLLAKARRAQYINKGGEARVMQHCNTMAQQRGKRR